MEYGNFYRTKGEFANVWNSYVENIRKIHVGIKEEIDPTMWSKSNLTFLFSKDGLPRKNRSPQNQIGTGKFSDPRWSDTVGSAEEYDHRAAGSVRGR
jgi:hypothetical protein